MKIAAKTFHTICSALASAALAVSLVPVSAVSALADDETLPTPQETIAPAPEDTTTPSEGAESSETTDPSAETDPVEPVTQTYTVTYKDGASGKVFAKQSTTVEEGSATPAFEGSTERSGYIFAGWTPKVAKKVTADVTYTATWKKTITDKSAVVPYITVKGRYSTGTLKTYAKNIKAGKKATVKTSSKTHHLDKISMTVSTGSQLLDKTISSYSLGVKYRVLVKGKWSSWASNGKVVGNAGKAIQAVQAKLTGDLAKYYSIYYRTRIMKMSASGTWLNYAKDGKSDGTSGYDRAINGLTVVLKKTTSAAPSGTGSAFITKDSAKMTYSLTNASGSKSTAAALGKVAGRASKSATAGSTITADASGISGGVKYTVYTKGSGWRTAAFNGASTGISGKGIMAMKMKLTGNLAKYYDVYYRVYLRGYGWLGWAKNYGVAGQSAYDSFTVCAYQVKLQLKGGAAVGSTANANPPAGGILSELAYTKRFQAKAKNLSSDTNYLILVDTSACRLAIFQGSKGNWTMIKYWLAGVGAYGTPTKTGTFTTQSHIYVFGEEKGYNCWYATQWSGNYLFHSEVYQIGSMTNITSGGLGTHVSHGCVRLKLSNAKWLYYNVPLGTKVKVY